jgi:hypothetical protein
MEDIITGIVLGNVFLPTEIVAPSTVGCANGGRWSRSNRGDMHRLYFSYLIADFFIPYWVGR